MSTVTYEQLYRQVGTYSLALKTEGVSSRDRVVGYLPNCPAAIKAMLGTASIAAV